MQSRNVGARGETTLRALRASRGMLLVYTLAACGGDKTPTSTPGPDPVVPALGAGASLEGRRPFPSDNPWNTDVSAQPVDPNSAALIASCGATAPVHPDFGTVYDGAPNGIPYVV